MSVTVEDFLAAARASLRQSACDLALSKLAAEYPAHMNDPRLREVVAKAVSSLAHFGQSDRNKLAVYAAARGRTYIADQARPAPSRKTVSRH